MADNVTIPVTSDTIAADDIGGAKYQRVKTTWGPDGTANDVDTASGKPLPAQLRDSDGTDVALSGKLGALGETAPATDTASSGLNGRLQRIAQRITSLIALVPAALTGSGNFKTAVNEWVAGVIAAVAGTVAHDGADSGNPVKIGGRARSSEITAVSNDDRADFITDLVGKQIVLPYANPENFVSGATSDITGTTATTIVAAPAAGLRNYITHIIVTNSHATVSTFVNITEETTGTVLYTGYALAAGGGFSVTFPTPLRMPTTAKALQATCVTTGANVRVSASGYKGA